MASVMLEKNEKKRRYRPPELSSVAYELSLLLTATCPDGQTPCVPGDPGSCTSDPEVDC